MIELSKRERTPILAYVASALFLLSFAVATLLQAPRVAASIHLLFVPVLALLVAGVEAPAWARIAGFGWAGLALLADALALAGLPGGAPLGAIALLSGASWMYGASMADEGAGHALGAAAAIGLAFSAMLDLASRAILVGAFTLGTLVEQLALVAAIVWFAVLAKDLRAGKRHFGGPVKVYA